jgi:hypothetical protein
MWCEWRNAGEFDRRRVRYEGIVRVVSGMTILSGKSITLSIDPDKNPSTMKVVDYERQPELFTRANETNLVSADRRPDGRLTVRICTYSMGHAGVYGLYYSGGTPAAGEVENSFGIGAHVEPVAPNWWRVADYSQ